MDTNSNHYFWASHERLILHTFDFSASVGEIVLVECLKRRTLITLPR